MVKTAKKAVETVDIDNADDNVDTVKKVSVVKKTFKKTTMENVDSDNDGVADVVKKTVVKTKKVKVDKAEEQTYDENSDDSAQDATTPKYFDTFPNVQHGYSAPKVKVSATSSDDMKTGKKVDVVKTSIKKTTTDTVDNNDDGVADQIVKKTFTKKTKSVDVEEDVDDNAAPQKSAAKVGYVGNNKMDANVDSMKKVDVKKTSFKKVSTDSVDDDGDGVADETVKKTFTKKTKNVSVEKSRTSTTTTMDHRNLPATPHPSPSSSWGIANQRTRAAIITSSPPTLTPCSVTPCPVTILLTR